MEQVKIVYRNGNNLSGIIIREYLGSGKFNDPIVNLYDHIYRIEIYGNYQVTTVDVGKQCYYLLLNKIRTKAYTEEKTILLQSIEQAEIDRNKMKKENGLDDF